MIGSKVDMLKVFDTINVPVPTLLDRVLHLAHLFVFTAAWPIAAGRRRVNSETATNATSSRFKVRSNSTCIVVGKFALTLLFYSLVLLSPKIYVL